MELRDLQNFFHFWRQANHFHRAAFFHHFQIIANEFTDAGTIEIVQGGKIQKNILIALLEQAVNGFTQSLRFEKSQAATNIDERDGIGLPDLDDEIHGRDLEPRGPRDSTSK